MVDNVLDKGLKKFEEKAPFVKDPPMNIYNNTKEIVMVVVQPPLDAATTVLQFSKGQANNILATSYGHWAVTKIDNLSAGAEKLIDRFCKLSGEGEDLKSSGKFPSSNSPAFSILTSYLFLNSQNSGKRRPRDARGRNDWMSFWYRLSSCSC